MKIALVHDYLSQDGGAEKVLEAFAEIWPDAPIFTLFHDKKKINYFDESRIRQSFLSYLPFVKSHYQWYLPFMPLATEHYNLKDFDVVLSNSSAFAKGVLTDPETIHISYCHTPTRFLWTDTYEYIAKLKYNKIVKIMLPRLIHKLRIWDKISADRVDVFIANSKLVQKRIRKFYGRNSLLIYPFANMNKFFVSDELEDYFVSGGRMVSYKKFDLLVEAFNRLGIKLKLFGDGPEIQRLKAKSRPNIEFLGKISDEERARVLSKAKAFLHPQLEDFGITAIESMASGRPVIAFGAGGALESVVEGKTGTFFYKQTWEEITHKILYFDAEAWDSAEIRKHAEQFSLSKFKQSIEEFVIATYNENKRRQINA